MADSNQYADVQLKCTCGTGLAGLVLANKQGTAVALFNAHHAGPECAPTVERTRLINGLPMYRGALPLRVTPDRICRSAWWVKSPAVPERWVHRKPAGHEDVLPEWDHHKPAWGTR